jgi:hypothetical protein
MISTPLGFRRKLVPLPQIRHLSIAALVFLASTGLTQAGEWQVLFDGKSFNGWKASSNNEQFQVVDGVIQGSSSSKTHFLITESQYRDFELEFEVKLHDTDLNSDVQIRTSTTRVNAKGDSRPSVHGPQVDLGKSPGPSGHLFGQGNGRWFTPKADLERNSLMINGAWNQVRVLAKGKVIAPNLRKLAASGVNFTRAYTAAPVCSPSRTAFFSGVAPWKSGHYHNTPGASVSEPLNNALSLAGAFKQAGYMTAGYGKITHGWDQRENWDVKLGHKRDPAPAGAPLTTVGRGEQDWGPIHLAEEEMNDTLNADAVVRRTARHTTVIRRITQSARPMEQTKTRRSRERFTLFVSFSGRYVRCDRFTFGSAVGFFGEAPTGEGPAVQAVG